MKTKVAVVKIQGDYPGAFRKAVELTGALEGLNTPDRPATIKIGLFDPRQQHHTSLAVLRPLVEAFDKASHIYLAESDNYCAPALIRLERFGELFTERVSPFSLSDDPQAEPVMIAGEEMTLSPVLFKPHVLISTHVLRTFSRGSIIKNLFGCTPEVKKAKYHKTEVFIRLLADLFEAAGGIDLAVLDAAKLYHNASDKFVQLDLLILGGDALAVETVGFALAGVKLDKVPFMEEFTRRRLGTNDLEQIDIVGISEAEFAELKKKHRELKKLVDESPRGPGISDTIDCLVEEGWFDRARSAEEVTAEIIHRGYKQAKKPVVETTPKRRTQKTLERVTQNSGWAYQRKPA
jgi:hypothetical protein